MQPQNPSQTLCRRGERRENLPIAKQLNKFITLPNLLSWKVHESDVLARGRVLSLFRTKRTCLPDYLSILRLRSMTVTRHGFLVVYEELEKGLIIDLRAANKVLITTDRYKSRKISYNRCHIKIRLAHGNVHLFVKDDIAMWTSAISHAQVIGSSKPIVIGDERQKAVQTDDVVESSKNGVRDIEKIPDPDLDLTGDEDSRKSFDTALSTTSPNSGIVTVVENPEIQPLPSIRRGHQSVTTLRRRLEKKLVMRSGQEEISMPTNSSQNDKPRYVTSIFIHSNEAIIDSNADEEPTEKKERKEWWNRSLRC
ncbi:unnamed protein product [Caenorhabditis bovis]|uniref:DUF7778 domain-containing protein n=1 Tax=Caenorhabditis bovis TaxID=2654633 RepID=A0A8S1EEI2_9PELO|nr:unnamed protein product [Caenorhabditis bovis]